MDSARGGRWRAVLGTVCALCLLAGVFLAALRAAPHPPALTSSSATSSASASPAAPARPAGCRQLMGTVAQIEPYWLARNTALAVAQFELVTTELGQRRPPVPPGLQLAVLRAANDLAYYGEKRTLGARAGRQAGKVSADLKGLSAECR